MKRLSLAGIIASTSMCISFSSFAALEEIIVTAQKRQESVQDIPIAITAFSGDALEALNMTNMYDLEMMTPGLVTGHNVGYAQTFLRGVGTTITFVGADSSTATYVDGYYISFITATMQELYDVERVEILKGPQATLYGRNASGGAINYVSRKPQTDEFGGKVSFGYGSDDEKEIKAYFSGPVTDTLAFSFAALGRQRDSYINFSATPSGQTDDIYTWGFRAKLLWQPTDSYEAELSASHTSLNNIEYNIVIPVRGSIQEAEQLGFEVSYADTNNSNEGQETHNRNRQDMLFLTQQFTLDSLTLKSLTGLVNVWDNDNAQLDGSPFYLLNALSDPSTSKTRSQEFQLLSDDSKIFSWILGASYFKGDDGLRPTRVEIPLFGFEQATWGIQETEAWAAYAEGSYDFTEKLTFTLGARYTEETKDISDTSRQVLYLSPPSSPEPLTLVNFVPGTGETWEKLTYRAVLNYALNDDLSLYYSNSRGFKSGAYNLPSVSPAGNEPVNPEVLDSNEIGLKGDFLDGRLRINAAAFIYDLSDTQAQVSQGEAGSALTLLASAGDAAIKGGEIEIFAAPTDKLNVVAGFSYLDTEYKDFNNFPASVPSPTGGITGAGGNRSVVTDVRGNPIVRSPEYTANLALTYTMPLDNVDVGGSLSLTGMWAYNDGYCFESACRVVQDSYNVMNISGTYTTEDERWKVTAWINNLFDEEYYNSTLQVDTGDYALMARPVYGGMRLEYNF